MVTVLNETAGNGSNLIFCIHVGLVPDGIGQVCLRAVAENRTAVGLGGVALLFQLVQIAANCFLCNVIILGKVADKYTLFRAQLVQNFIFPLNSQHAGIPLLSCGNPT